MSGRYWTEPPVIFFPLGTWRKVQFSNCNLLPLLAGKIRRRRLAGRIQCTPAAHLAKKTPGMGFLLSYLVCTYIFKDLVQRYNPLASLTEQERIRKTANRVGLEVM